MLTFSSQFIYSLFITSALSAVISFIFFKLIQQSSSKFFALLNVYSPKSPTKAKLLGGLGISAGIITSMLSLLTRENLMSRFEESFVYSIILSILCITFYGYVDDRYETRARHKIIMQIISLSFLTFYASGLLASPTHTNAAIAIATVLGFLLINGANLLDGLDTLSIKLGTVTSIAFIGLGYYANSTLCIQLSVATIASLSMFYYFNRPPAKIYMGEIGSCLLGLTYTAQVILCYSHLRSNQLGLEAISTILIAVSLPICELGISFLRRLYFKRSPFSGDKLHFHYILKSKQDFSATMTTNFIAFGSLSIIALGYFVALKFSPIAGFFTTNFLYCGIYFAYCRKDWVKNQSTLHTVNILDHLKTKSVHLVNTTELEGIRVRLVVDEISKKQKAKQAA